MENADVKAESVLVKSITVSFLMIRKMRLPLSNDCVNMENTGVLTVNIPAKRLLN